MAITTQDPAHILTKNYVNADDTFVASSGQTSITNLYDRDTGTLWTSSGAASDATTVTVDTTFNEGSTAKSRTITRILVINHNLKAFNLYYWDGAAWQLIQAFTAQTANYVVATFNAITTAKIRLEMLTTQTANQEKTVGELVAADLQVNCGDLVTLEEQYRDRAKLLQLGDGTLRKYNVRWSTNKIQKYEARARVEFADNTLYNSLLAVREAGTPFLWYPETVTRPDRVFYCNWAQPWKAKYMSGFKGAGYGIDLDLKEV